MNAQPPPLVGSIEPLLSCRHIPANRDPLHSMRSRRSLSHGSQRIGPQDPLGDNRSGIRHPMADA